MHLLWSSTKVRKYFEPFNEGAEKGPQILAWIKSKQANETLVDLGKGNLCYLAKGQIWQSKMLLLIEEFRSGTNDFNKASLCEDGWPNL